MSDISTIWNAGASSGDWEVLVPSTVAWTDEDGNSILDENNRPVDAQFTAGGILAANDDLFTAALISIFTDATAAADDTLPTPDADPRGWWAGSIGSKLWLRTRSRADELTRALVKNDIEEALAWMILDDVVASIVVETEWLERGQLGVRIILKRTDGLRRALAFATLWENT